MKVLVISPLFPPQGSGAEISSMLECKELAENGVNVVLVTNNYVNLDLNDEWIKKVKIYQVPMFFTSFIYPKSKPFGEFAYWFCQGSSWKYICKIIFRERVDLIHIQHAYVGFKKEHTLSIVLTIRDYWPICPYRTLMNDKDGCCSDQTIIGIFPCRLKVYREYLPSKLPHLFYSTFFAPLLHTLDKKYKVLVREKLIQVDQLIAISDFIRNVVKRGIQLKEKDIEVLYPPIVVKDFVPKKKSSKRFTFTFIGALEIHKGIMNLLKAFSSAVRENADLRLLICGDGALKPKIHRYVSLNNLSNNVKFLGKINHREVNEVYKETDVVVVPSLWPEPFGRVVMESLIAGRIVIVNPIGGLREQVDDGVNGFYANCYNPEQLKEKMLEIASHSVDEIISMGIKARDYTLKKFDKQKRIKKLLKSYEKLL